MTREDVRIAYLAWTRRALWALVLPIALTALVQAAASASWWGSGPDAGLGVRWLFIAVGAASVAFGRSTRDQAAVTGPLDIPRLVALSWRLLTLALAPAAVGAVLALMTGSVWDYFLLLAIALVGIVMLYPRFEQWLAWSGDGEQ